MNAQDTQTTEPPRHQAFLKAERRYKRDPETTADRLRAREQVLMLAEMRKQHAGTVTQNQQALRTQLTVRRQLLDALREEPRSVPQLAVQVGITAHEALWYMAALRKRGLIEEAGMDDMGDFYLYRLSQEAR